MSVLVFAWGNPGRGDDALGPALIERLEAALPGHPEWGDVTLLTDFQLQPEHALDLEGRAGVLLVDAGVSCLAPFEFARLHPAPEIGYTTHAMSPAALLQVFSQITGREPPPAFLLTVRGTSFELGEPLSDAARNNLEAALVFIAQWLTEPVRD